MKVHLTYLNDEGKSVVYARKISKQHHSNSCLATGPHLRCHNLQRRVYLFGSWHQHENLEPSSPKPKDLHGINLKQYTTVCLRDGPWQHRMQFPQPVRGADGITTKHGVMNMARLNRVYIGF
jgi:hypothetical protein